MKLINEEKHKSVITTKFVIRDKSPIVYVSYDEDGDWQLFGTEEITTDDVAVVSVSQILAFCAALAKLPNMEQGTAVYRENENSEWILQEQDTL